MMAFDVTKSCTECGAEFTFTAAAQEIVTRFGLPSPTLCPKCAGIEKQESNPTQKQPLKMGQPVLASEAECPKCPKCEKRFVLLTDYSTVLMESATPGISLITFLCSSCKAFLALHMVPTQMFQPQVDKINQGLLRPS
jgi:hypothetical protein